MKEQVQKYVVVGAAVVIITQTLKFLLRKATGMLQRKIVPNNMEERLNEVEEVMRS